MNQVHELKILESKLRDFKVEVPEIVTSRSNHSQIASYMECLQEETPKYH